MTKFDFSKDPLFAKPVKTGFHDGINEDVFWLNGKSEDHNAITKLISENKTRQQGFEKAVYALAANEDGSLKYKNNVGLREFHDCIDRTFARDFGMMILGLSKGEEKNEFDQEAEDNLGNSKPESGE